MVPIFFYKYLKQLGSTCSNKFVLVRGAAKIMTTLYASRQRFLWVEMCHVLALHKKKPWNLKSNRLISVRQR